MPPKKESVKVTKSDDSKTKALERAKMCQEYIIAAKSEPLWHKFLSSGTNPAKIKELQYSGDMTKLHEFIIQKRLEFKCSQKSVPYTDFFLNRKRFK